MVAMSDQPTAPTLVVRRYQLDDAAGLARAVIESAEHLRPWMPWMAGEPSTLEQRNDRLASWIDEWDSGGDRQYAITLKDRIVGSCGLMRRAGPRRFELGYWVHVAFTRQGIARAAAGYLCAEAFRQPDIDEVVVFHDAANVASASVPRGLGFTRVADRVRDTGTEDVPVLLAPSESGVDWQWVLARP